jgi:hypothetical protein
VLVDFATPEKQPQPILPGDLSLAPGRRPAFPRSGLLFGRFLLRHRARQFNRSSEGIYRANSKSRFRSEFSCHGEHPVFATWNCVNFRAGPFPKAPQLAYLAEAQSCRNLNLRKSLFSDAQMIMIAESIARLTTQLLADCGFARRNAILFESKHVQTIPAKAEFRQSPLQVG